jgi:hypothetical protein
MVVLVTVTITAHSTIVMCQPYQSRQQFLPQMDYYLHPRWNIRVGIIVEVGVNTFLEVIDGGQVHHKDLLILHNN